MLQGSKMGNIGVKLQSGESWNSRVFLSGRE